MACVAIAPMTSVWPSAALLATKSAPMLPPAPGLFSTTTGCPRACCSFGAIRRAERSTGPPGAYGTTRWIGLVWAKPCAAAASAAATRILCTRLLRLFGDEGLFALLADRRDRHDQEQRG